MFNLMKPEPGGQQNSESNETRAKIAVKAVINGRFGGIPDIESQILESQKWNQSLLSFKRDHQEYFLIGIGGSSLGVQVLAEVYNKNNFHFIDNVDAEFFESKVKSIKDLKRVGWIITSKSGRTIETLAALELVQQIYQENQIAFHPHCLVVTEEKSSDLFNWAQTNKILVYPVPVAVGGRYSILSAVGLVPAILMDLDITKFSLGVEKALRDESNLTQFVESILTSFARNEWISVLWCYSSRLRFFGLWWQQLWAESLAKKQNKKMQDSTRVSTPLPLIGATDQHSVLQQIMEGEKDKFVIFLRVNSAENGKITVKAPVFNETKNLKNKKMGALLEAEAQATGIALEKNGISHITLKVENLSEENLAYMFMFFQLAVISLGEALNINVFDQPGVELGKIITKEILAGYQTQSQSERK